MLISLIQAMALTLTLIPSIFLIKSKLALNPHTISELSSTKYSYNTNLVKGYANQHADSIVGFILILSSFFLQSLYILWAVQIKDFSINSQGFLNGLGLSLLISYLAYKCSEKISETSYKNTMNILVERSKQSKKYSEEKLKRIEKEFPN